MGLMNDLIELDKITDEDLVSSFEDIPADMLKPLATRTKRLAEAMEKSIAIREDGEK